MRRRDQTVHKTSIPFNALKCKEKGGRSMYYPKKTFQLHLLSHKILSAKPITFSRLYLQMGFTMLSPIPQENLGADAGAGYTNNYICPLARQSTIERDADA